MATNGIPGGPSVPIPAPVVPDLGQNIDNFMNSAMPEPSEAQRQIAMMSPVAEPLAPIQAPVQQPIQQPVPVQPTPQQPVPMQPQPEQPASVQPAAPDYQAQIDALQTQMQTRETAWEQQRQDMAVQSQRTQQESIMTGARQHAQQQYQQFVAAGNSEENSRAWANAEAGRLYQALNYQAEQQQAVTQTQAVAQRHGVNPQDIPTGMTPDAMESYALMLSRNNRTEATVQATSQQVMQKEQFDSGIGASVGVDPTQAFINNLGDPTKGANQRDLLAWSQYMKQNLPNY